jgi:aspartyl protease family protein
MSDGLLSSFGMMFALSLGLLTGAEHRPAKPVPLTADLQPAAVPGQTIARSADGLFYIEAKLNGAPVRLALDTGANVTVLCARDARRAGLLQSRLIFDEKIVTGGGHVPMARAKLASAKVGDRDFSDLPVVVARGSFPVSILGQDLMRRIGPVLIDGDQLTLGSSASAITPTRS